MASKYERITNLYLQTVGEVAKPEVWPQFLTTACHNFRLSFDKQVLLYAQRPDATAVLPIEGRQGWNQRLGRWVNRGSKGIAILDSDSNGQARIKYYFDIADTHEGRHPRPVPIWTVHPEQEQAIIETLENSFGALGSKENLGDALLSAASNVMEDNFQDYLAQLTYYKEGSFLEPLDGESLEVIFKPLLQNSIGYMLLVRCGIDPGAYFQREDFSYISGFNTLQTINALGTATSDISQMCMSEIARTMLSLQRQQNRTFEEPAQKEYAV
ncbi:MAG: DNA helicase, partial [Faecousia sp.]